MLGSTCPILRSKSTLMTAGCCDMRFPVSKPDKIRQRSRIRGCFIAVIGWWCGSSSPAYCPDLARTARKFTENPLPEAWRKRADEGIKRVRFEERSVGKHLH